MLAKSRALAPSQIPKLADWCQAQQALRRLGGMANNAGSQVTPLLCRHGGSGNQLPGVFVFAPPWHPTQTRTHQASVPAQDWQAGYPGSLPRAEICLLNTCGHCRGTVVTLSLQKNKLYSPLKGLQQVSVMYGYLWCTQSDRGSPSIGREDRDWAHERDTKQILLTL